MPKFYISKFALTKGVYPVEATVSETAGSMIVTRERYPQFFHGEGREWHRNKESAIAKANEMRVKKISSLKEKIANLETMTFYGSSDADQ